MTTWAITELSTIDADGNYQDDLRVGIENIKGFALDTFAPGSTPEEITIASVVAALWRYRKPHELTGPTVATRVIVASTTDDPATITAAISGDNVNITIPADTMEVGQEYQLVIDATDVEGGVWSRTREYRAVA